MKDHRINLTGQEERPAGVLDLLLEQYETAPEEDSFLDKLVFHQLYKELRAVDPDLCDRIITLVCSLCGEYSRAGYLSGVNDGVQLMMDLRT